MLKIHVIKKVAVERPAALGVCGDQRRHALAGLHIQGVFARNQFTLAVFQLHPHAVEVNGVLHHGVVDEDEAQPLIFHKVNRAGHFAKLFAIKRPHVAFHVAGQMQFKLTAWFAAVRPWREGFKIAVDEYSTFVGVDAYACLVVARTGLGFTSNEQTIFADFRLLPGMPPILE